MTLGNLEALSDEDARWLAQAQVLYGDGKPELLGGLAGKSELYGYSSANHTTLVNPGLESKRYSLSKAYANLVYSDGWVTREEDGDIELGVGSVAIFSNSSSDLGHGDCARLRSLEPLATEWTVEANTATATIAAPRGDLHIVFQQRNQKGVVRTSGGAPPAGKSMVELIKIFVTCKGQSLPVTRPDDHVIWSGLSWAWGKAPTGSMLNGEMLTIRLEWCAEDVTSPSFQLFGEPNG
jgi:hypothetical protein